jgi:hypothetical protein
MDRAVSRLVTAFLAIAMGISGAIVSVAAEYPPSIELPKRGEQIFAPAPPVMAQSLVVVPVARASMIPTLVAEPTTLKSSATTVPTSTLSKKPVEIFSGVIVGGLSSSKADLAPVAATVAKSNREIQFASDVPTVIQLSGFNRGSRVQLSLVSAKNRAVSLGTLVASSKGVISLPPLTLEDEKKSLSIRTSAASKGTVTIRVRAVR